MPIAIVAVTFSIIAIVLSMTLRPTLEIGAGAVGTDELANNSVTSDKVADSVITDADIVSAGISRIADNSITLGMLTPEAKTGIENIADSSITSEKIADGAIMDADIAAGASISPSKISGTAWTSTNDGAWSGLDADIVDGINSSQFLRNDTSGTISGNLTVDGSITHQTETRYYTVPFSAFVGSSQTVPYTHGADHIRNTEIIGHGYNAPVNLPHGATITKFAVYYYRDDAASSFDVHLYRVRPSLAISELFPPTNTDYTIYESSVTANNAVNNENYAYYIYAYLDPNDSDLDVRLGWVRITYTITQPLP